MRSLNLLNGKAALLLLVAAGTLGLPACDKSKGEAKDDASEEEKKQAQIDALLRENGSAPAAKGPKHPFGAKDSAAPAASDKPSPAEGAPDKSASAADSTTPAQLGTTPPPTAAPEIKVLNAGSGKKTALKYHFTKGRKRAFNMDMTITSASTTNGQKAPSPPPIGMELQGSSVTLSISPEMVQRETTFLNVSAASKDLPPPIAQQMNAQFALLKGTQLIESVTPHGQVTDLRLKDAAQLNPAVLGLIQSLKDGMTNAFVPLPSEPVGVGAKWKSTNTITATGMQITQTNDVELVSLSGSVAKVKLSFAQQAPAQDIKDPRLPPEAKIQLLSLKGGGSGNMTIDLEKVLVEGMVNLDMTVETKVAGPMVPAPQTTKAETGVKIQVKLSE